MLARYADGVPLLDGAVEAVQRLAHSCRLAVASSSNRPLIDAVLAESELASRFAVTVSSEEVARGKPAPDVYLRPRGASTCRPTSVPPSRIRVTASVPPTQRP